MAGDFSFDLHGSNGSADPVTVSMNVSNAADLSTMADAINAKSAQTGVTAISKGSTIELVSDQGYDINIADMTGTGASMSVTGMDAGATAVTVSTAGTDSMTAMGQVELRKLRGLHREHRCGQHHADRGPSSSTLNDVASINIARKPSRHAISVSPAPSLHQRASAKLGAVQNRVDPPSRT